VCKVALVGFGTVGSALARLLYARRGEHPLSLSHVCNRGVDRKKVGWTASDVVWTDSIPQVLASDADIVLELMGDIDSAYELASGALRWGKSLVTANKQLIAHFGSELLQLARDHGQYLGFGACVAGGVPVLSGLQEGLAGDRLVQIGGILNGTCNYILTRIEQAGSPFSEALRKAQQAGFAEADPSFDLDGQDAAAKLAILARVGMKIAILPDRVIRRSIRDVTAIDFEYAHELGCSIRQISTATLRQGEVCLRVGPSLVSKGSPLAQVSGSQNLIVSTGEFGGETSFGGQGAGGEPTAVAVLSDLIQAANYRFHELPLLEYSAAKESLVSNRFESRYFVRFVVRDRPGIISSLADVFAHHGMNIDAIHQRPGLDKACLPFVITLETCCESQLSSAIEEIGKFDFLVSAPLAMPIVQ
jgi:homoserine dehydrogenase